MTPERKAPHPGAQMQAAAIYVAQNPGCTRAAAARHVSADTSTRSGYKVVSRAIAAGMIHAERYGSRSRLYFRSLARTDP